jgi:prevent-host-death family protein
MSDNVGVKGGTAMPVVGIRELSRNTSKLVEEVQATGQAYVVTRHGAPAVALVPIPAELLEDLVLARAPEFIKSMQEADEALAEGKTRSLASVLAEIESRT